MELTYITLKEEKITKIVKMNLGKFNNFGIYTVSEIFDVKLNKDITKELDDIFRAKISNTYKNIDDIDKEPIKKCVHIESKSNVEYEHTLYYYIEPLIEIVKNRYGTKINDNVKRQNEQKDSLEKNPQIIKKMTKDEQFTGMLTWDLAKIAGLKKQQFDLLFKDFPSRIHSMKFFVNGENFNCIEFNEFKIDLKEINTIQLDVVDGEKNIQMFIDNNIASSNNILRNNFPYVDFKRTIDPEKEERNYPNLEMLLTYLFEITDELSIATISKLKGIITELPTEYKVKYKLDIEKIKQVIAVKTRTYESKLVGLQNLKNATLSFEKDLKKIKSKDTEGLRALEIRQKDQIKEIERIEKNLTLDKTEIPTIPDIDFEEKIITDFSRRFFLCAIDANAYDWLKPPTNTWYIISALIPKEYVRIEIKLHSKVDACNVQILEPQINTPGKQTQPQINITGKQPQAQINTTGKQPQAQIHTTGKQPQAKKNATGKQTQINTTGKQTQQEQTNLIKTNTKQTQAQTNKTKQSANK